MNNVETWGNSKNFLKFSNRQGKNLSNIEKLGGISMKKWILCMILLVVGLNTRVYVEDWNIISHFDTNEVCVSLFDKYDLYLSAKGVEFYVED